MLNFVVVAVDEQSCYTMCGLPLILIVCVSVVLVSVAVSLISIPHLLSVRILNPDGDAMITIFKMYFTVGFVVKPRLWIICVRKIPTPDIWIKSIILVLVSTSH